MRDACPPTGSPHRGMHPCSFSSPPKRGQNLSQLFPSNEENKSQNPKEKGDHRTPPKPKFATVLRWKPSFFCRISLSESALSVTPGGIEPPSRVCANDVFVFMFSLSDFLFFVVFLRVVLRLIHGFCLLSERFKNDMGSF